MRDCTPFSDKSYFEDLDTFFASNGLKTDMVHGAELFQIGHNLILTVLAFSCLTFAIAIFADVAIPKSYHRHAQVFLAILAVLSFGFTILTMFVGNDKNELLNYDAWMILYCYDQYVAHEPFYGNKKIADFAYVVCILLIGLEFGSISMVLYPGNCCFCCDCSYFICCQQMRLQPGQEIANNNQYSGSVPVVNTFHYSPIVQTYEPSAPLLDPQYESQEDAYARNAPKIVVFHPNAV
jgi:hypothetical protein